MFDWNPHAEEFLICLDLFFFGYIFTLRFPIFFRQGGLNTFLSNGYHPIYLKAYVSTGDMEKEANRGDGVGRSGEVLGTEVPETRHVDPAVLLQQRGRVHIGGHDEGDWVEGEGAALPHNEVQAVEAHVDRAPLHEARHLPLGAEGVPHPARHRAGRPVAIPEVTASLAVGGEGGGCRMILPPIPQRYISPTGIGVSEARRSI